MSLTFDDPAALKQHYREVRMRLRDAPRSHEEVRRKETQEAAARALFLAEEEKRWAEENKRAERAAIKALVDKYTEVTDFDVGKRPSIKSIIAEIAEKHHMSVAELIGPRRTSDIIKVRLEAYYECFVRRPDVSLPEIGRRFGGRDHTTVAHGARRYAKILGLPIGGRWQPGREPWRKSQKPEGWVGDTFYNAPAV